MGLYDDDEGYDDFDEGTGQKPTGIQQLRAAQKKAAKEAEALREQNAKLHAQLTRFTLRDVLEKKSLRPGLARAMVADGVDASDDNAINQWLANPSNQEDYAFSLAQGGGSPQGQSGSNPAADFAAFQNAQSNALPADHSKLSEAARLMDAASSDEEVAAALAALTR